MSYVESAIIAAIAATIVVVAALVAAVAASITVIKLISLAIAFIRVMSSNVI